MAEHTEPHSPQDPIRPEIVHGTPADAHEKRDAQPWMGEQWAGEIKVIEPMAIVAICFAIASWVAIPVIGAIVALVLAPGAKRRIRESGGRLSGRGLVTAAQIVSALNIVVCIAFFWLLIKIIQWIF